MSLEKYILKHGAEPHTWYVDIKGVDLDGNDVWMSGNSMPQGKAGFGGFYDFQKAIELAFFMKGVKSFTPSELEYCSDMVDYFIPKEIYIGYSPLDENKDNELWKVIEL